MFRTMASPSSGASSHEPYNNFSPLIDSYEKNFLLKTRGPLSVKSFATLAVFRDFQTALVL